MTDFRFVCPYDGSELMYVQEEQGVRSWDVDPDTDQSDELAMEILDHITDDSQDAETWAYEAIEYFCCKVVNDIRAGHKFNDVDALMEEIKEAEHNEHECPGHADLWKAGGIFFDDEGAARCSVCQGTIYSDDEDDDPERQRVRNAIAKLRADFANQGES